MNSNLLAVKIMENVATGKDGGSIGNTFTDVSTLVNVIIRNSITLISLLLTGLLIFGGLKFIMSAGGDPKKADEAKGIITNAIIGFVVVFLSVLIVKVVETITGFSILNSGL